MEADDLDNLIADSLGGVQSALDGERKGSVGSTGWAGEAVREMQQGPGKPDRECRCNEEFFSDLVQTFQDESFQKAMTNLLQGIDTSGVEEGSSAKPSEASGSRDGADAATPSGDVGAEDFLKKFIKSFDDAVGSDNNFGKQLTTLMTSMLSSDLICQPLQQIVDTMEPWLKSQKALSASERSNYEAQMRILKQILAIYKGSPDPLPEEKRDEVQRLLSELQDYGQPPDEIMKQIAPTDADEGGENFEDFMKTMGLDADLGPAEQDLIKKLADDPEELTKVMKGMADGVGNDESCKQQ